MTEKFKLFEISKDYLYLKKLFDNEKAKILSEQNQKNYVIDLMKNTKWLYMSLYNLFQKKLVKLQRYLNNILNKKWIKFSVSFVDVSILFVFKKDEKLHLCVNYKNLNTIICESVYERVIDVATSTHEIRSRDYYVKLHFLETLNRKILWKEFWEWKLCNVKIR